MMPPEDFDGLLGRVRAGDESAATVLYRRMQPGLLRYLRAQEPRVADDLAGEVWLTVARGLPEFQGDDAAFRAWVFTVARRRIVDHRRRGIRRPTAQVEPEELEGRPAPDGDPSLRSEGQEAVDLLVQLLPPAQAEVLLLRVVADLDVATVAEMMGRTPTWVRVNQHRALRRLEAALGDGAAPDRTIDDLGVPT